MCDVILHLWHILLWAGLFQESRQLVATVLNGTSFGRKGSGEKARAG